MYEYKLTLSHVFKQVLLLDMKIMETISSAFPAVKTPESAETMPELEN